MEADRVDQVKRQIFSDVLRSDSPLHSFTRVCFLQSAVGFEYAGKTEKHASQKGRSRISVCHLIPYGEKHLLRFSNMISIVCVDLSVTSAHVVLF